MSLSLPIVKVLTTAVLAIAALSSASVVKTPGDNFELLILHNNDMHARFEQTSQQGGTCTTADREAGKCYGGFPRVAHVVKEARKAAQSGEGPPVLYLNAGDTYTGTAWFTIYKWKIAAEFVNALQPDAVSLGNNEVDKETLEVSPFLENLKTNILACNVVLKSAEGKVKIEKSVVFDIKGVKVGVVGYLTPNNNILDSLGQIEYIDEVIAVASEVKNLQASGVKIIIALGHSTLAKEQEIAREVTGIDLVIAGNKNTFYWNGQTLTDDHEPIVVTQASGKKVPIIPSTAYNTHLGSIKVTFDNNGEISEYNAKPILLDDSIPQDTKDVQLLETLSLDLPKNTEVLGKTAVALDGQSCSTEECNLGNLIADAIVHYYAVNYEGERWTDAPIAIIPSGVIARQTIAPPNRPADVTRGDLLTVLPLESSLVAVTMNGQILKQVLEHSVSETDPGSYLQFSGIRAVFAMGNSPGTRLKSAVVRCWECNVPLFYEIEDNRNYKILMPASMANGEFGYSMLTALPKTELDYDEITCTAEFIKTRSPVYPEVAGRTQTGSAIACLGNHEFDNGVAGLSPFITNISCPVLAANLNLTNVPELQNQSNLMNSVVFDINNTKIGIVGYLTPDTKFLAIRNNVEYIDEIVAVRNEVALLKSKGVNIIIALGHSGFVKDVEIAREVEEIDLVIGGHTNTFLWNGNVTDSENPEGPYPTLVEQKSGRLVPAVQAYGFTKYLGKLHIIFNADGEINSIDGNPILLDNSITQDPAVLEIVNYYQESVQNITEQVIGNTSTFVDGHSCRIKECNMGNFMADAVIHNYVSNYRGQGWTDAPIAVIHSGGIRSSFDKQDAITNITKGDTVRVMPFDGILVKIRIDGLSILKMLEYSVRNYNASFPSGHFLQMSGMKVKYDMSQPSDSRVMNVSVLCGDCLYPEYNTLNKTEEYNILMPAFLANGGDGFNMFDNLTITNLDIDEISSAEAYIQSHSPLHPAVEGRIILENSLGNHEFDNGISGLTPFIENLTCPILAANLVLTKEPELQSKKNLMDSVVFDINGTKIGVIGYLTPDTKVLAIRNDVEYIEEVIAIQKEAAKLKQFGVNILIALGHSGFTKDLEIAEKVEDIDVVIGGHTNTFLWNGTSPDVEKPEGMYPTLVKQKSGRLVPAVQAYAYTKYLGKLHIVFDANGEIISSDGNPVLLDNSIPQDPEVLAIVNRYRESMLQITEQIVGHTSVILDGQSCRLRECNMGNLITDAMIQRYASEYKGYGWTDAPIAIIQGGGIRASVAHLNLPANITQGDLLRVMPFDGNIVKITINGSDVLKMLEHSVWKYNTKRAVGQFLQMSGMMVEYDFRNAPGKRVSKVYMRCGECTNPEYTALNKTGTYKILMPAFLSMGGDGFSIFDGLPSTPLSYDELGSTIQYVENHSPVYPAVEGRIVIHNLDKLRNSGTTLKLSSLGNHEFDNGVSGLTPFIENLTCPVLCANLVLNKVPELAREANLKKSIVLDVAGHKIGIVGYLTPETKVLAVPNDVEYSDEIEALNKEVKKLQSEGIKIIIAVGHSGYHRDLEIAKGVDGLDLIIGGHTNTFLWNGTSPDAEQPEGFYPTYVEQPSGRKVPVVQAYAYTKYLGKLYLLFDSEGNLVSSDGTPILLDQSIPQDEEVLQIIHKYKDNVVNITEEVVGRTAVILSDECSGVECNIGNLITDAMVYKYASEYTGEHWTDAPIAIIQAGGIRAPVAHAKMPTNITTGDLLTVMPFDGNAVTVTVNGSILNEMIEHSVASGEFLQYSGIKVVYDRRRPSGSRVVDATVRCWACDIPKFTKIVDKDIYKVIMPSFLATGGDGYSMFHGLPTTTLDYNELISTKYYISRHSPIYPQVEGRITFLNEHESSSSCTAEVSLLLMLFTILASLVA
ncbi:unnamed protein product [Spodoptera exigua]|nr:unnamed protein product [Spodoptera exigua]